MVVISVGMLLSEALVGSLAGKAGLGDIGGQAKCKVAFSVSFHYHNDFVHSLMLALDD